MKKCELLAPAGGKEQYIAAVENGADAIYLGGQMMNARMSADNFGIDQMEKAIDFGHLRDVKTYITMNTLVTDDEVAQGVEYAYKLYKIGADGLIIQDLGLGYAIKENLPNMPLHLSTQATVYNRQGVEAAKRLGYDRVVLARELSVDEIRKCCKPHLVDIEVFVHGALCFCYSGQCQLSRTIGGRSANRGTCAQPCRLPYAGCGLSGDDAYTVKKAGVNKNIVADKNDEAGLTGHFLSPKDLCSVDFLDKLLGAGAASLKIEGRMKSPEYVATVVRIYRKYIDLFYQYGKYTVDEDDRRDLLQIFNRGGFTSSYLKGEYKENVMAGEVPKHQGVYAGTILDTNQRGNIGRITPANGIELERGDIFEIRSSGKDNERFRRGGCADKEAGERPTSGTVTFLEKSDQGSMMFGDIKGTVSKGDEVYRIISANQMRMARDTFKFIDFEEGKFRRKRQVKVVLEASAGKHMKLTLETADGEFKTAMSDLEYEVEETTGKGMDEGLIAEKLCKTGGTPFEVTDVYYNVSPDAYVPVSRINRLRRDAFEILESEIRKKYKREEIPEFSDLNVLTEEKMTSQTCALDKGTVELFFYHAKDIFACNMKQIAEKISEMGAENLRVLVPLGEVIEDSLLQDGGEQFQLWEKIKSAATHFNFEIMFYLEHVSKGYLDNLLENNFDRAIELVSLAGNKMYIGNLGWIATFQNAGVAVYGDFGLNICNGASIKAYDSLGMSKWISSLEYGTCHTGTTPLMTIEYPMDLKNITDRKGIKYSIDKLGASRKSLLRRENKMNPIKAMEEYIRKSKNSDEQGIRIYL